MRIYIQYNHSNSQVRLRIELVTCLKLSKFYSVSYSNHHSLSNGFIDGDSLWITQQILLADDTTPILVLKLETQGPFLTSLFPPLTFSHLVNHLVLSESSTLVLFVPLLPLTLPF